MSETAIVLRNIDDVKSLSKDLSQSGMVAQALRKNPADIFAIVLTGAERGLKPMQALSSIHIINGKPTMSADLMGALVQSRSDVCEYLMLEESTGKVATYETKRKGQPKPVRMSFTIEQAKQAKLGLKDDSNWHKYPEAMLRARALATICRAVYPDLCLGLYDSDSGELTDGNPIPESSESAPDAAQMAQQIRDNVAKAKTATPKGEVVEGEVVSSEPAAVVAAINAASEAVFKQANADAFDTLVNDIKTAATLETLAALQPRAKASPRAAELKPLFVARKNELSKAGAK